MDQIDSPDVILQIETLVQMLRTRASRLPDRQAFLYLVDGKQEDASLTFAEVDQRARSIAAWLQQEGVTGGRALLLYPPGLDFITAFFGCLYAGVAAVPAYPPRLNRPSQRIQAIVADAQVTVALTTTKIYDGLERRFDMMPELAMLRWLNTEAMPGDLSGLWQTPEITSDSLAFLQYTSGSTGSPKGVMLSHGNLVQNLKVIHHGFQIKDESSGAFWLPSYHDMGLIGGILEPVYAGVRSVLMAPAAFLQRPIRWLEAISQYRAEVSGAPNFAYQMCVDKISPEQRAGLDLSCWNVAFCGAEPIRLETLDNFAETFAPHGFRRESFYPCYGLAESTLMVSGGDVSSGPLANNFHASALSENQAVEAPLEAEDEITLVSCGHAMLDQQIVIADPSTMVECGPGEIGEIWTAGPSVAQGYWKRPELTEQIFHAHLAGSEKGSFLRTGDLGFLHGRELYVTGRLKDLIIIHGRNHYPQDIEHTVGQCHEALEAGMSAAFPVSDDGEEKLVLVHEVTRRHRKPDVESVVTAVRRAVAQEHQLQVHAIVLIRPLSVPRTSSGKIKRHACKQGFLDGSLKVVGEWRASRQSVVPAHPEAWVIGQTASDIAIWMVGHIATQLGTSPEQIDIHAPFVDYGLDSVQAVSMTGEIETRFDRSLSPTLLWDYPTIEALASHLAGTKEQQEVSSREDRAAEQIAVIGLSCRFPGADSPEAFWQLLQQGNDAIQEVPRERWDLETFYDDGREPLPGKMNTRWGGFLSQVDQFDAAFFGISPREAARLDPQQRLLLEVTWEALERAGQNAAHIVGSRTGVFIGISSSDYSRLQFSDPELIDAYAGTGNAHSIAANRLSYTLDLQGPSIAIDTACSSSLVATHLAMNSLRSGEVNLALAGGVNLLLSPDLTITFSQARMMAADGRCKTFDARADGYVRGEGCGVVVLKRLSDAQRDGDPILAVLRGSAVNQDGRSNGLTAPSGLAQQTVIRQALTSAGVQAADISYVEAHGTGTSLGDPIEIHALDAVLDDGRGGSPVAIGSVKTNIGHLEAAAGIAGMIKTILALIHEEIPPHLHFRKLNPHIKLENSRLAIGGGRPVAWPREDWHVPATAKPRLAGVSSFGFGGTNAHIIVQEAPLRTSSSQPPPFSQGPADLFTISAKGRTALQQLAASHATYLADNPSLPLADVCYTANTGRAQFAQRLAVVAETTEQLAQKLSAVSRHLAPDDSVLATHHSRPSIAFLFTGQGAQYEDMGRTLYETQPIFRASLDRCISILEEDLGFSLLSIIYPEKGGDSNGQQGADRVPTGCRKPRQTSANLGQPTTEDQLTIHQTSYTQPALFAIEYALAELWRSWGIEPDVVMGHSVGEYVAACVAGVMSLEDGLKLISARGKLMGELPAGGAMAAVFASEDRVKAAVTPYEGQISIAAINGPANVVISGMETAVAAIVDDLASEGFESRLLTVSHAFHSQLMEPMLDAFEEIAGHCRFQAPRIPLVSNLTGQLLSDAPDAAYWRQHVRQAVRFADGMQTLANSGTAIFLEIGPQPHLTGIGKRCLKRTDSANRPVLWLASLRKPRFSALRRKNDLQMMLGSLAELYTGGLDIDWPRFYGAAKRGKVILPTYPFQRERHWLDVADTATVSMAAGRRHGAGSEEVRRLPTAVPLFEATLDLSGPVSNENVLRKNALAVAHLFWGEGVHKVTRLAVNSQFIAFSGWLLSQTTFNVTADGATFFQTFGYDEKQQSWKSLAGGEVRRSEEEPVERSAISDHSDQRSATLTRETMMDVAPETQPALLHKYLQDQVAEVLGLDEARPSLDQPLDTLGMDSLMALELKNRVELNLQVDLPVVTLLQGPTLNELAAQLLDLLAAPSTVSPIQPVTMPGEPAPLSYGQQAMWVLHQLLPSDISFNVTGAARIKGELDIPALRRALQLLVDRHASLRTRFTVEQGLPVQIVHEIMRTGQPGDASPARDVITPVPTVEEIDAVKWDEETLDRFLEREAHSPLNLEQGPLLRLILLKRAAQEYVLLLSLNHLITDFWSMSLLVQELYLLYAAERTGEAVSLAHIDLLPADYARWQAEMLAGPQGEALRQYWLQKLAGELPRLDLPTDRPRPAVLSFDGDAVSHLYGKTTTAGLKALSQEHGATLATTLLAAFQTLLYRYTGQEDLLVGSVIAGRERPELQNIVGYFVNPVALRADFSGNPTFAEFLAQVRQTMLEAIEHQEYPLPRLAEELAATNKQGMDPSRPPLFETMFIMQRAQGAENLGQVMIDQGLSAFALGIPGTRLELGGGGSLGKGGHGAGTAPTTVEPMPLSGQPAQFDLTLMMAEVDDELAATLHYNTQLFDKATAVRLLQHLQNLLDSITATAGKVPKTSASGPVAQLPLLARDEREKLLVTWNDTQAAYAKEKTLHQLVSEQAQRTPDKIAVTFEQDHLTYAQLEQRANELANHLQDLGVGPETLVGLFVERSLDMVIGLLGILKAGGAYIPLDPDFPPSRISLMLEDAQPAVLITQEHLLGDIEPLSSQAVCLDTWCRQGADRVPKTSANLGKPRPQWPAIEEATPGNAGSGTMAEVFGTLLASAAPHNLAYVIYTSGSTGRPKGVQITHRSAVNFLQSMQREPGLAAADHLLAVTTLSFDIALLELFLPLISGARVTIASRETAVDGIRLQQLLDSAAITIMQATPTTWRLLLEAGWAGKDDLKLLCGGEALPPDLARQLLPRCASLWNMYGPTETTVWSTLCPITQESETISIGRPIANTRIYILDKEMQPVPTGVVGDLYIGGSGLARGYLNRPQLTAKQFVPDPFARLRAGSFAGEAEVCRGFRHFVGTSTAKMYKTGDLARYMPDGSILFLGRDDFQVKIRGHRIELGDIETAVAQHPAVAHNICIVHRSADEVPKTSANLGEEAPGTPYTDRQLVSYTLPHAGKTPPDAVEMRAFLRAQLPDYMIPAHFITLDELPLMPNGKIDRRALPAPAGDALPTGGAYVPPRSELEAQVAELSASVLNLEKISIHDSFFDLGGNSLLATRLIFQARELFEVQIPLRQLFMQPTVAGLSQAIEAARQNGRPANGGGHVRDHQSLLGGMTLGELQAEVWLDPAIRADGLPPAGATSPQHVLLTGATGFVGAFLLRDLLRDTEAAVHCLVRAADPQAGLDRLRKNMAAYGLWDETFAARITAVPGDLGQPHLGLSDAQFQSLARRIDMIVHNGALVNFVYTYREHKASNVLGTQEILRLAAQEKVKAVHFVSTLSIFHTGKHDDGMVFGEDAELDEVGVPFGGYAQSKWVGEKLVLLAAERGIPVAIYRPGLVSGDSRSGVWNTADMMSTMTRACIALGAAPELDVDVDIVPVDYVSKALVTLALKSGEWRVASGGLQGRGSSRAGSGTMTAPIFAGQIFNLSNPQTMPYDEILSLINDAGVPLRMLPFEQWRQQLMNMAQQFGGESWNPFLPLLDEITAEQVFMPTFDHSHTLEGLAGTGVTCPPVGPELLQTYLTSLVR